MRHLALALPLLAACPHPRTPAPPAPARRVVIVESGHLFALDPSGAPREVPGYTHVSLDLEPHGPYLVDEGLVVDLRDLRGETSTAPAYEGLLGSDAAFGSGARGEVFAIDSGPRVSLTIDGHDRALDWPDVRTNGFALSPDGTKIAVIAGPEDDARGSDTPLDLYLADVAVGQFGKLTTSGDALDVAFVDPTTLLVATDKVPIELFDLATGQPRALRLPDGWQPGDLADYARSAPLIPISREDTDQSGLYDRKTARVIAFPAGDVVLAVAPDASSAAIGSRCRAGDVLRGLARVFADGHSQTLLAVPDPDACQQIASEDAPSPTPVSAAYTSSGALVYAIPGGKGWQVHIDDRVALESSGPLRVFAWP